MERTVPFPDGALGDEIEALANDAMREGDRVMRTHGGPDPVANSHDPGVTRAYFRAGVASVAAVRAALRSATAERERCRLAWIAAKERYADDPKRISEAEAAHARACRAVVGVRCDLAEVSLFRGIHLGRARQRSTGLRRAQASMLVMRRGRSRERGASPGRRRGSRRASSSRAGPGDDGDGDSDPPGTPPRAWRTTTGQPAGGRR